MSGQLGTPALARAPGRPSGQRSLLLTSRARRVRQGLGIAGHGLLLLVTCSSALAVLFIIYYIARDALRFFIPADATWTSLPGALFQADTWTYVGQRLREFFTSTRWYPTDDPAEFGVLSILYGSGIVTLGATFVAVPVGVSAAICLSDVLPFSVRQVVKPVIEILAAIPSVAFGFFALVVFAPFLQDHGGAVLAAAWWIVATPVAGVTVIVLSDILASRLATASRGWIYLTLAALGLLCGLGLVGLLQGHGSLLASPGGWLLAVPLVIALSHLVTRQRDPERRRRYARLLIGLYLGALGLAALLGVGGRLGGLSVPSGVNVLNVSIILGLMAVPTIVSVSEEALQSAGRELREGAYALGSTRTEMLMKVIIPAASSGICAAVILGIMRAVGETMVVWMASGNAAHVPEPWYDLLARVRTLTATIAGEMGEADHVTGSLRYHVLWAMALVLLVISFACNLASEWVLRRNVRRGR